MRNNGRGSLVAALVGLSFVSACGPRFSASDGASERDAATHDAATGDAATGDAATIDPPPADAAVVEDPVDMATAVADAATAPPDLSATSHDCVASGGIVTLTNGNVKIDYDLNGGTATFSYGGVKKISGFYAGVQLASYVTSKMYSNRACVTTGAQTVVTNSGNGLPAMQQHFILDGGNKFLARVIVQGANLSSNWISPVVMDTAGGVDIGSYGDARLLWVPFDNDMWVSYNAMSINNTGTSFEAAAFYDNVTRNGIVVGSVTHDTWKSGVYYKGANNKLDALNVFGGAGDATWTHDVVAHGKVRGDIIYSPIMFVGYASDWRDLMEEYADANAVFDGRLAWSGGVPFGWNSWGKIQSQINYDKAVTVSDFIKSNLQNASFHNGGTVYVNLDSYWDNLSDAQLGNFVSHCHANGQKAGIYWAPFVDWGKSASRQVEGSAYTYGQIWLRDASGNPISLDGAYAVDPTHQGSKDRINAFIDRFKNAGFEYIKLDFLTHGALESTARFDANVQTGIQAYHQGMRYLKDRIAGTMFISESIAPLFPYQYGHARRVACDTYGAAVGQQSSHYELNSVTYGWWMSGRLYQFNDPDHVVLEGFSANDNMTRLISAVISGTIFLSGDDLTRANGQALAKTYLTNSRLNAVARLGKSFRPVEGNTGTNPSDWFVLRDAGTTYLAVFNFSGSSVSKSIGLARAGLDGSHTYSVTDLWSGATSTASGTLQVTLDSGFAKLLQLN